MDYILQQIRKEIEFCEISKRHNDLTTLYRVELEYGLMFLLSNLWDTNINKVSLEDKEIIMQSIFNPSIGHMVDICRRLDLTKTLFIKNELSKAINQYPAIRNERIGHGFLFTDGVQIVNKKLKQMVNDIFEPKNSIFQNPIDLILVTGVNSKTSEGINFKANGVDYKPWICPAECSRFRENNVYALDSKGCYTRLSPFIEITKEKEFFIFKSISDRLSKRVEYNQILKTANRYTIWDDLEYDVENDGLRKKTCNNTIVNVFRNNYKKYVDVGIKKQIIEFLEKNKASVCGTIWGHGGVGKTATVQSICEDLANARDNKFNYIAFVSAKDRAYDYLSGTIVQIDESINSFGGLIRYVNSVMGNQEYEKPSLIQEFKGKLLLVIDDYETFPANEKQYISSVPESYMSPVFG